MQLAFLYNVVGLVKFEVNVSCLHEDKVFGNLARGFEKFLCR